MKRQVIYTIILILLCSAIIYGAISTGNDLHKFDKSFIATTRDNLLEGYWSSLNVTSAFYNVNPTGVHYYFSVDVDSYEVGYIDIPMWKHHDVTFEYNLTFTAATGTLYVASELWSLSADGNALLMASLSDSDEVWDHAANVINGRIDLSADTIGVYNERMRIKLSGGSDTKVNPDSAEVKVELNLPFNPDYMKTDYYKQMEGLLR